MDIATKRQVIEGLLALDDVEFVDFLYDLLESRREDEKWNGNWHIETYVIGHSISTSGDPVAYTEVLARPKPETMLLLAEERASGFSESGRCPLCKTIILAYEKLATCPICKSDVECT